MRKLYGAVLILIVVPFAERYFALDRDCIKMQIRFMPQCSTGSVLTVRVFNEFSTSHYAAVYIFIRS